MSVWRVLIIDDEAVESVAPKGRHEKYNKLSGQKYDSKSFSLTFASSADNARILLKSPNGNYDIVLMDVRLKNWGDNDNGTIFKDLFTLASSTSLVALVSAHWDPTAMTLVRDFLLDHPKIDQPLFFTFNDFNSGALAAIGTQIVAYIRRKRSMFNLDIKSGGPLHILHLSDLHFGSEGTQKTLAGVAKINYIRDKIKAEWPQGPHIIAITGDIGNTGHPNDYEEAFKWLSLLAEGLDISLPSARLLLVPGNHDVSLPLAGAQLISLKKTKSKSEKKQIYLKTSGPDKSFGIYASRAFGDFAKKISYHSDFWSTAPIGSWVEFGFAEYGVVFSGLNTSKQVGDDSWPLRLIDEDDISYINERFEDRGISKVDNEMLHITLSHHSPIAYPGAKETILDSDYFMNNFLGKKHGPRLLLHGHQHRRWGALPDSSNYFVVSAPSPNKVGQGIDSPRGLNMLCLEREGSRVRKVNAKSLVYLETGWTLIELPNKSEFEL